MFLFIKYRDRRKIVQDRAVNVTTKKKNLSRIHLKKIIGDMISISYDPEIWLLSATILVFFFQISAKYKK